MIARLLSLFLFLIIFASTQAQAVTIPGRVGNTMGGAQDDKDLQSEKKAKARRVFSSELKNITAAEKMDELLQSAQVYLLDQSGVNFTHQQNLMLMMDAKKFKYTRKVTEFKPGLDLAMKDLNKTRRDFKAYMVKVNESFQTLKADFSEERLQAEKLWNREFGAFTKIADAYFQSQGKYLNEYNKLVGYIMSKAGSYYFDSRMTKIAFYNVEDYTLFAESIDRLNKISFNQRQVLADFKPLQAVP